MKIGTVGNELACKVLFEVELLAADFPSEAELTLETYTNGREQGFALSDRFMTRKAVFSRSRHSNNIVVYTGMNNCFAFNTNIPNDPTYCKGLDFPPTDTRKAAEHILEFLMVKD